MRYLLALALVILTAAPARADDDDSDQDNLDLLVFQVGAGMVSIPTDGNRDTRLDGMMRLGTTWRLRSRLYGGGYVELHTVSFEHLDVTVGAQLQLRPAELSTIQLRGGVGASDTGTLATAGISLSTIFVGVGLTARRSFSTGGTDVSLMIELQPIMFLIAGILRN